MLKARERQLQIENSWDYESIGWSLPQGCKNKIQEWWCARPTSKKLEPYPDLVALCSFGTSTAMIYQHPCFFYCLKARHNSSSSTDDVHEAGAVCLHDRLWIRLCLQNAATIRRSLQARSLLNLTESSSPSVTFLFMAYDARQIWGSTLSVQLLANFVDANTRCCRKCLSAQGPAPPPGHLGKVLPWCSARLHAKHCKYALVFRSSKKSTALVSTLFVLVYIHVSILVIFCIAIIYIA